MEEFSDAESHDKGYAHISYSIKRVTAKQGSWIASIVPLGAIFGALLASYLLDWIGRNNLLICSMMAFMASWAQIAMASSFPSIILARFVSGVCVGLTSSSGSVYLAEMVQQNFRASQGIITGIYGTLGIFFMSVLVTFGSWRALAWAGAIMCTPPMLFLLYLPESPYYLYYNSPLKSLQSFEWLLEKELETKTKFREMKNVLKMSKDESSKVSMFTKTNAFPVFILTALHMYQQLTGINIFIFYSTTIFSKIVGERKAEPYTILMTVLNVISNFFSSIYQGYTQRRKLLKLSTMIVVPCLWIVSVYFAMKRSSILGINDWITILPVAAIYLYIFSFALGWGPVPFLFMGEGLPSTVRGNATGKAMALNWASAFLITKSYSFMSTMIGDGWIFLLYSICTVCGGLLMNSYMPETFEKSLNEMDTYYTKIKAK